MIARSQFDCIGQMCRVNVQDIGKIANSKHAIGPSLLDVQ